MSDDKFIKGRCYTNLDNYEREEWPSKFVAVPRKGERIVSKSGKQLYVMNVEHHQQWIPLYDAYPYIIIELGRIKT